VWATKYRRKILKHYVRKELIRSLYKVQRRYPDWYFEKINTGIDHVHLLIEVPPKYKLSEVIQKLKVQTSKDIKNKFKFINKIYEDGKMWSVGYFVSSVGLNEDQIKKYIEKQNKNDRGFDVTQEFS